ncbi:MAG: FecR domain-containing protein [Deltaproteobacteria bacterium]|nr:FecR domain-containing protein [Deltaproteobacteria bacterium]MBW2071001.1 FecR domain-containing protein [Deltaproteobacteria bacterium]
MNRRKMDRNHHRLWLPPLLIFLAWCFLAPVPALVAADVVGEVTSFSGSVYVERQGKIWQAQKGEALQLLDQLKTGKDGKVEILFIDRSRVRMAPGSTLEITEYLYQPENKKRQTLLSLWSGKARFIVNKVFGFKTKGFVVQTPSGTAGVRGTDFIVEVEEVKAK